MSRLPKIEGIVKKLTAALSLSKREEGKIGVIPTCQEVVLTFLSGTFELMEKCR